MTSRRGTNDTSLLKDLLHCKRFDQMLLQIYRRMETSLTEACVPSKVFGVDSEVSSVFTGQAGGEFICHVMPASHMEFDPMLHVEMHC